MPKHIALNITMHYNFIEVSYVKDIAPEGALLVPLFIRSNMFLRSKDCYNETIITSLQGAIKEAPKGLYL